MYYTWSCKSVINCWFGMSESSIARFSRGASRDVAMWLAVKLLVVLGAFSIPASDTSCSKPKLTITGAIFEKKLHFVRPGPLEIHCSGDSRKIAIFSNDLQVHSDVVNSTTVRAVIEKPTDLNIECRGDVACDFDKKQVIVELNPEITQFNCYTRHLQVLNCSWSVPNSMGNYTLSYNDNAGESLSQACKGFIHFRKHFSCIWDMNNIDMAYVNLFLLPVHLQVCNVFGCVKKTLKINVIAVTKLDPPKDLKIVRLSPLEVRLEWALEIRLTISTVRLYYTVDYWFPGIQPRLAISNITFASYPTQETINYIKLPCPDKQYTIRVACRPTETPPEYMSDFASISFYTDPDPEATGLDPTCLIKPIEENPPVMIYKDHMLKNHVHEELKKYNKRRGLLTEKAMRVKKLQLLLKEEL